MYEYSCIVVPSLKGSVVVSSSVVVAAVVDDDGDDDDDDDNVDTSLRGARGEVVVVMTGASGHLSLHSPIG